MRQLRRLLAVAAIILTPELASAQSDVIRGRVIGPDSMPIERALVTVTSLNGSVSRNTRTDKAGRYTITFPGADGDYFVNVAALGFAPRRFQIKRTADQEILIANAKLGTAVQQLDAVNVRAERRREARGDSAQDVSGSERAATTSAVSFDQLGDLAALAASLPGVQYIPGADDRAPAFSVLGLTADQNATTLNGLAFGGSSLPRDANVSTSLVTTPYDVSRGNFSGGLLSVRTQPGSNYSVRTMSTAFDAPSMQWTDAAARSLGQRYRSMSVGGRLSGPIRFDKAFYSLAYQAGRRGSDLQTLLNTDALGLRTAGIAVDSVSRLLSILQRTRVPTSVPGFPNDRMTDNASVFGTIDFNPPTSTSGEAYNLTFNGTWTRQNPATLAPTELPSHGGDRTNWYGGVQLRQSGYYGIGILSETSVGLSRFRYAGDPFVDLPSGTVRVSSSFDDAVASVQNVSFGGNPMLDASQTATSAQVLNQLSWFSESNRHRLKLTTEVRREVFAQDFTMNRLGSFGFSSLADLEAGRAAMFVRTLGSRQRSVGQYVAGVSLGDSYKPTTNLQIQYGVRLDGNRFTSTPNRNDEVARVFGVENDRVPNRVYVSPRVGFSWAYGASPRVTGFEGAMAVPRGIVRGGVGVFQGTPNVTQLGDALDNTGLPSSATQVTCVGAAVPTVDWAAYVADPASIPTRCGDGSTGSFNSTAPNVMLFDRTYTAPRSVRSNLQWSVPAFDNRFVASIDATYSLNLGQPGVVDLNFDAAPKFALADEQRPVFARSIGIVPTTGAIAGGEARMSSAFNRIIAVRSDMRSETKQLMLQVRPASFSSSFGWALSYVYAQSRERVNGFTSAATNPLESVWGRSSLDSRHQLVYAFSYNALDVVRVSWYGTLRSGTPYTPMIAADVNGDGFANDRAFIFDPSSTTDTSVARGMRSLLASGSSSARECLRAQVDQIAGRNSCQGPWTSTATLTFSFNPLKVRLPQRADFSLQLSNPLAAADLLLHGENDLRGWGQQWTPTSQLLFVRGFDAAARRYRYEVNQRFGATASTQTATRLPVALTAILRIDVGPTRERQSLTQMLDRGRTQQGRKLSEPVIKALYGTSSVVNPMAQILRQADSLELTGIQADSIAVLNRRYAVRLDSIWTPVAKYLALLPTDYDRRIAYDRYRRAREATVDLLIELSPTIRSLLTRTQLRKLPALVAPYLDTRYLASVRSGTAGTGLGAVMMDGLALPPGVGNAQAATVMMIHGGGTP
jgi:hypothetical protein